MISEHEAIATSLAVGTAMLYNDKEAREEAYADLDADSLRRVIRWTTRMMLHNLSFVAGVTGNDIEKVWSELCMAQMNKEEDDE